MSRPYPDGKLPMISNENLPLKRTPHLALGMFTIAEYAQVEAFASKLLTDMAAADPLPLAAIYGELRQGHLQAKALRAVAKAVLTEEDAGLLFRLMKLMKMASDGRDQLAHRMWMYDDQFPNDIVLADPALAWTVSHLTRIGGGDGPQDETHVRGIQKIMKDGCQIWSMQALEDLRTQAVRSVVGLQAFSLMLKAPGPAERATEREKVTNILTMGGV